LNWKFTCRGCGKVFSGSPQTIWCETCRRDGTREAALQKERARRAERGAAVTANRATVDRYIRKVRIYPDRA